MRPTQRPRCPRHPAATKAAFGRGPLPPGRPRAALGAREGSLHLRPRRAVDPARRRADARRPSSKPVVDKLLVFITPPLGRRAALLGGLSSPRSCSLLDAPRLGRHSSGMPPRGRPAHPRHSMSPRAWIGSVIAVTGGEDGTTSRSGSGDRTAGRVGGSVAINGVTSRLRQWANASASCRAGRCPARRSGQLVDGSRIGLEPARAGDAMGGHIVRATSTGSGPCAPWSRRGRA
jgi:hypothetical protein